MAWLTPEPVDAGAQSNQLSTASAGETRKQLRDAARVELRELQTITNDPGAGDGCWVRATLTSGARARATASYPMAPLSADEVCSKLGLSETDLQALERMGRVFSVLKYSCNEREYPAFLTWPELQRERLNEVLDVLHGAKSASGTSAYLFFAGVSDLLGHLTPVEVLLGQVLWKRETDEEAESILALPDEERTATVLDVAQIHVNAIDNDW